MRNIDSRRFAPALYLLLSIFILRVIGQMFVAAGRRGFLPPMEEWQSGLLPYPLLLFSQLLIIVLYGRVCFDFSSRKGFFVTSSRRLGKGLFIFGIVYFTAMVLRYIVRMIFYPEARWFGGTIPILLHCVLAAFFIIVGIFHRKNFE